jgi:hypothetical protein
MRAWVIAFVLLFATASVRADDKKPEQGYLVVYSTPYARIFVDGKDTKKTTPISTRSRLALPPGKHTLTFVVRTAGMEDRYTYSITIEAGKTTKIMKDLGGRTPPARP